MQQEHKRGLVEWIAYFGHADIPVLKQTARDLETLREDSNRLSARSVAAVIAADPMLTVKLLRYLQQHKRRSQTNEVIQVEQALLMLGIDTFFNKIPAQPLVQDALTGQMEALVHLLHVLHRAHRASEYAQDWATRLNDTHYEEVRIAALLHDLAEMLMWSYAPIEMLRIHAMQEKDRTLRSKVAQEQVFGFSLGELQQALIKEWGLPGLLLRLMDDSNSRTPRVRNVILAVNLARHSAHGWDDAALPDDYAQIGELLRLPVDKVMRIVGVAASQDADPAPTA